jgi:hypothetical protein
MICFSWLYNLEGWYQSSHHETLSNRLVFILINYNAKKSKTSVEGNCAHILVFQQSSMHTYHWDFAMTCFYFHYCQLDKLQYFSYMLFFCQSSIRDSKRIEHNIHQRCFLLTNFWLLHFNCLFFFYFYVLMMYVHNLEVSKIQLKFWPNKHNFFSFL